MTKHVITTMRDLLEADARFRNAMKDLRSNPEDIHHWKRALQWANRAGKRLRWWHVRTIRFFEPLYLENVLIAKEGLSYSYMSMSYSDVQWGYIDLSEVLDRRVKEIDVNENA